MTWQQNVQGSIEVQGLGSNLVNVPSRDDYIQALIEDGEISAEAEFGTKPNLVKEVHRHWIGKGQVGCVFAQALASRPNQYGMDAVVFADGNDMDVSTVAAAISHEMKSFTDGANVEGLSILLPSLTDLKTFAMLIISLGKSDEWDLCREEFHVSPDLGDSYFLVGLDYILGDHVPSAALALGPFEELPMTRRGPIASLEIRPKSEHAKPPSRPLRHSGAPMVSHLAQIPFGPDLEIAKTSDPAWQQTEKLKLAVLDQVIDARAKADVTLSVPILVWEEARRSSA